MGKRVNKQGTARMESWLSVCSWLDSRRNLFLKIAVPNVLMRNSPLFTIRHISAQPHPAATETADKVSVLLALLDYVVGRDRRSILRKVSARKRKFYAFTLSRHRRLLKQRFGSLFARARRPWPCQQNASNPVSRFNQEGRVIWTFPMAQ